MKNLASVLFCALLCMSLISCEEENSISSSDPSFGVKPGGGGTTASPAILYCAQESTKGKWLSTIQVCDADGANQATIVTGANTLTRYWGQPTWSGSADAIAYIESDTGRTSCTLKTTGVTVSGGKAIAGTTSSLLTVSKSADQKMLAGGIWSPSANEIAYSLQDAPNIGTYFTRKSDIYAIPSSGGSPSLIYSSAPGSSVYHMAWNYAGTKIAILEWEVTDDAPLTWTSYIKIIDRSSGTVDQSVDISALGLTNPSFIAWSRSGLNTIAIMSNSGSVGIYTLDLDHPGSTSQVQAGANYPAWSPDNSKMIYRASSGDLVAETLSNGTTTTLVSKTVTLPYWKK